MNLNYITIGPDYYRYIEHENKMRYQFQQRTEFINDYFSKAISKYKFKTDGTFDMISIEINEFEVKNCLLVPDNVLKVELFFDRKHYEKISGSSDFNYYLELLEMGFKKASEFKKIPLDYLLNLIKEFKAGGCKNEWVHKRKKFKEQDLEVVLTCELTTNYFQLITSIVQLSTRREVVKGVLMRTETGVSIYHNMFKDIVMTENIIITDKSDAPRVIINKADVFKGKLNFVIKGDEEIKKMLSFEM